MVSVLITTYNSASVLEACLNSLLQQDYPGVEIIVVDNASSDGTREILERIGHGVRIFYNDMNTGFAAAQNQGMAQARGDWLLSLNPDVLLSRDCISKLVAAGEADARTGAVCGKLLRWRPGEAGERTNIIDSTGIYFLRNLRHLDRGSDEIDRGQYERPEYVIGATGAAALYRRTMVEDVSVDGEFFDEDFFAYREDADVAWRAQLLGWRCLYTPQAVAWHVRRVTPERFKDLPDLINRHSIKNRFLMRAKNLSLPHVSAIVWADHTAGQTDYWLLPAVSSAIALGTERAMDTPRRDQKETRMDSITTPDQRCRDGQVVLQSTTKLCIRHGRQAYELWRRTPPSRRNRRANSHA